MNVILNKEDIIKGRAFIESHRSKRGPAGDFLFVYGTLKRGKHNNDLLRGSRFIGAATTVAAFPFEHICVFPFPGKGYNIQGEVFTPTDADTWASLDRLEGHPNGYERLKTTVALSTQDDAPARIVEAWLYFYKHAGAGAVIRCQRSFDKF